MNKYLDLYLTFARVGGFTFGGGYAMIPMLEKECIEKKKWATEEELMDYFAIAQCTPGVIAINTATFIGRKVGGILGGIIATIGMVTPSWIIITIIALFLKNFAEIEVVQHAMAGITVGVCALVLNAVIKLGKKAITNWFGLILAAAVLLVAFFTNISAAWLVIASGIIGVIYSAIVGKISKNATDEINDEEADQ